MKKGLAFGIIVTLLITLCDIPVLSEPAPDEYVVYREYREDLLRLQEETARVYLELHQEKNPQAVYEHVLQVIHQTAVLLGDAEAASMDIDYDLQPSLQNYMEMLLLLGLNEEKTAHLMDLGYTEEDIVKFMDWILTYNDFNHHVMTGFTPEEMERFYSAGLTDAHIADLQAFINEYYASPHTVQEGVNQEKGLQHIQISLSLIALKILEENHVKTKEKDTDRLQNAEGNLAVAIQNISDKPSLEKVKAYSKEVYKAAEQKIRNGEHQYRVDFFVGLQIYCGSLTALHGDRECGLAQIHVYGNVVSECALSPERPILEPVPPGEYEALMEQSSPFKDYIGLVEESNEANNMGVTVAFVKAPDTTFMQFLLLLFAGVGAEIWSNWTLPGLTVSLESLCAGGSTTISTIATGAVGAVILLLIFIPPVSYGEWPDAIVGFIEGEEILIIVDGSYGQGHILERAESDDPCIHSSHQAIVDDPYKMKEIVLRAEKLLYRKSTNRYLYYFTNWAGEWVVIIEEWGGYGIFELVTSFRADCPLPEKCTKQNGEMIPVNLYLDVLECMGYVPVNIF